MAPLFELDRRHHRFSQNAPITISAAIATSSNHSPIDSEIT
jgi:hypothetical protein